MDNNINDKTTDTRTYSLLEKITIGVLMISVAAPAVYIKADPQAWVEFNKHIVEAGTEGMYAGAYAGMNLLLIAAAHYFSRKSK